MHQQVKTNRAGHLSTERRIEQQTYYETVQFVSEIRKCKYKERTEYVVTRLYKDDTTNVRENVCIL